MNFRECSDRIYVIKKGDSLYKISRQFQVPLGMIMRANPYVDVYNLQIGDELCIPELETEQQMMPDMTERNQTAMPGSGSMQMPVPGLSRNQAAMPGGGTMPLPTPSVPGNRPATPGSGTMPLPTPSVPGNRPATPGSGTMPLPTPSVPGNQPAVPMPGPLPMPTPSLPSGGIIVYIVRDDDSIQDVLDRFDIDLEDLLDNNRLDNMYLRPGTQIRIPTTRR